MWSAGMNIGQRVAPMLDVQSLVCFGTASAECQRTAAASAVSGVVLRSDDSRYTVREPERVVACRDEPYKYTYHALPAVPYSEVRAFIGEMRSGYWAKASQAAPLVQRRMEGVQLVTSQPELTMVSNASGLPPTGEVRIGCKRPDWYLHNHVVAASGRFSYDVCTKLACLEHLHSMWGFLKLLLFKVVHHEALPALETAPKEPHGEAVAQRSSVAQAAVDASPAVIDQLREPE